MLPTRTIREAALYFREKDPQTCLTETAIRTLLRTGAVPSVKKYLVTVEALEAYLMGETEHIAQTPPLQRNQTREWKIK